MKKESRTQLIIRMFSGVESFTALDVATHTDVGIGNIRSTLRNMCRNGALKEVKHPIRIHGERHYKLTGTTNAKTRKKSNQRTLSNAEAREYAEAKRFREIWPMRQSVS